MGILLGRAEWVGLWFGHASCSGGCGGRWSDIGPGFACCCGMSYYCRPVKLCTGSCFSFSQTLFGMSDLSCRDVDTWAVKAACDASESERGTCRMDKSDCKDKLQMTDHSTYLIHQTYSALDFRSSACDGPFF